LSGCIGQKMICVTYIVSNSEGNPEPQIDTTVQNQEHEDVIILIQYTFCFRMNNMTDIHIITQGISSVHPITQWCCILWSICSRQLCPDGLILDSYIHLTSLYLRGPMRSLWRRSPVKSICGSGLIPFIA